MESFRVQVYLFALIFFCACSGENFKALNSEQNYNFSYNGFKKELKLNQEKNSFALVFFTKDCGVCGEQITVLNRLKSHYDFQFFIVLGDAKDLDDAKMWALKKDLHLQVFYEKKAVDFLCAAVGGVYGVPVLSFFKEGKMEQKFIGLTPYFVLENEIKKMNSSF